MSPNPEYRKSETGRFFLIGWIGLAVITLIAAVAVVTVRGQAVRNQSDLLREEALLLPVFILGQQLIRHFAHIYSMALSEIFRTMADLICFLCKD